MDPRHLRSTGLTILCLALTIPVPATWGRIQGSPEAVAAAQRLLSSVGGAARWRSGRVLQVRERLVLPNGEIASRESAWDLSLLTRRIRVHGTEHAWEEVIETESGWRSGPDGRQEYSSERLQQERLALRRGPFSIFRQLASHDITLRVELGERGRLEVYDRRMQLLCWFELDEAGQPLSWGSWSGDHVVIHRFGPLVEMNGLRLPQWTQPEGAGRIERLTTRLSGEDGLAGTSGPSATEPTTPPP